MKNVFVGVAHYKILLAILGVVSSIASFQVWKWNQEQHEKLLAEQQKACQQDLDMADEYVSKSKTLYAFYYSRALTGHAKSNQGLERASNNSAGEAGKSYILIYNAPASIIPEHPRYDGNFFEELSKKSSKYNSPPLMVVAKSFQANQATVTTSCSPKPFTVSLDNLYEISQKSDFDFTPPLVCFNLLLLIMSASPVKADTQDRHEQSFLQQFEQVFNSLKTYINQYSNEFSHRWGELNGELKKAVESSIGDLGIPDPLKAGDKIREIIGKQESDLVTTDPGIQGKDAQHEWHQQYTLGQSQSTLGVEGQKVQAQEAEMTNNALATSSDYADTAQSDIVTQDILKKMAIQNLQEVVITKSIQGEAQKQTRALAAANINLADMSGRMTEQARKEEAENRGAAKQIIEAAAFNDGFWEKKK